MKTFPTTCFVDEMPVQQIQSGNEKLMGILIHIIIKRLAKDYEKEVKKYPMNDEFFFLPY